MSADSLFEKPEDPLYDKILEFWKEYNLYDEFESYSYKNFLKLNVKNCFEKSYNTNLLNIDIMYVNYISKYNFYLTDLIQNYINYKKLIKANKLKSKFNKLLFSILNNNYKNIRYDLTLLIIDENESKKNSMIKYFNKNGLIYLLEKINPKDIKYDNDRYKPFLKKAEFIYNKLIYYDKYGLKLAWLAAVAKASYL